MTTWSQNPHRQLLNNAEDRERTPVCRVGAVCSLSIITIGRDMTRTNTAVRWTTRWVATALTNLHRCSPLGAAFATVAQSSLVSTYALFAFTVQISMSSAVPSRPHSRRVSTSGLQPQSHTSCAATVPCHHHSCRLHDSVHDSRALAGSPLICLLDHKGSTFSSNRGGPAGWA